MAAASGRPVHLNTLTMMPHAPDGWSRSLEFAETRSRDGLEIHPMFASNRQGAHFALGVDVPVRRDAELPRHAHAGRRPSASERLRDPALREQMRDGDRRPDAAARSCSCGRSLRVETVARPEHDASASTETVQRDRRRAIGVDPLDAFLDLSLDEDLETQFVLAAPPDADAARPRPRR